MTGRDLFGALTRFTGLLLAIYGIYIVSYEALGMVVPTIPHRMAPVPAAIFGAVYIVFGLVLLLGGGLITRLAYRQNDQGERPRE